MCIFCMKMLIDYRIAGNFDVFQPDRQIFKAIQCLVKDTDHPSKYFLFKYLKSQHSSKFLLYGIKFNMMFLYIHM